MAVPASFLVPGPGPDVPGCSLVSFHFLWAILCPQAVLPINFPTYVFFLKEEEHSCTEENIAVS